MTIAKCYKIAENKHTLMYFAVSFHMEIIRLRPGNFEEEKADTFDGARVS